MKNSGKFSLVLGILNLVGLSLVFFLGVLVGQSTLSTPLSLNRLNRENSSLFEPFIQAWDIVHEDYLEQPVDDVKLMRGSIKGMLESLGDPHTSYLDPELYRDLNAPLEGDYTGIGAWVDTSGEFLVIISPMPESPALEAGLEPGDVVVKIDGEDVTKLDPASVLNKILGPASTQVTISVQREDHDEILDFQIIRAIIPLPSVESELIEEGIGYIRLYTFGENSYNEFSSAIEDLLEQGANNMILDLRNNTGGIVDTAIDVASAFLKKGSIVMIEDWGDGSEKEYVTKKDPLALDIPIYILVNEGTASASEIVAGALQAHKRAVLIGIKTFGKGFIQSWVPLKGDNGAIRVTIARWLTPDGQIIQEEGLTPDFEVEYTIEDFESGIDPQINKAIDKIRAR